MDPGTTTKADVHGRIGRFMLADGLDVVMDLERSHGSWIFDGRREREVLDLFTCFGSSPVGYNHPGLEDPEHRARMDRACRIKPSNSDIYSEEMAHFVELFGELALPSGMPHSFFISGGALGVENCLKAAFDWKAQRDGVAENDLSVLHFEHAFHGRTGYTLSLTNTYDPRKTDGFPKFDWPRVPSAALRFPRTEESRAADLADESASLDAVRAAFEAAGGTVALAIIEPIQCEGGDRHLSGSYLRGIQDLCVEYGALFCLDEVQTGFWSTGERWCFEHFASDGVAPDLVAFGKKTQVCGFFAGGRMDEVENNVFRESSRINSTFGGNLADMVRCARYLEIVRDEDLGAAAAATGAYFLGRLEALCEAHPDRASGARGRGMVLAVDLPSEEVRDSAVARLAGDRNVLALSCGAQTLRFRPPLTLSDEEVDFAMEAIEAVLTEN